MLLGDDRLPPNFWSKVQLDDDSGCWVWTGGRTVAGYGQFGRTNDGSVTSSYTHRLVVALREELVPGMVIDHLCRNTSCCNPRHLEQVTTAENLRRGIRSEVWRRHCKNGHERTVENTAIRADGRICLICERERSRRYKSKQVA